MYKKVDTIEELQNEWRNPYVHWYAAGMPSFTSEKLEPWKQLTVKFKTREHRQEFADKLGYQLTDKTNVVWYPEKGRERNNMNRYIEEHE